MSDDRDVICRIADGDLDAEIVHRDADLIAFLDHRPVFKGHVLACPIRHIETLAGLPTELLTPLFGLVQRLSTAVVEGLGAEGSFTAINTVVSQSVPHLHVHVVPRTRGDGLRGFFWPRVRYAEGEAAEYAARLRTALAAARPSAGEAGG
jgi:histidine triad (HIT) family protein